MCIGEGVYPNTGPYQRLLELELSVQLGRCQRNAVRLLRGQYAAVMARYGDQVLRYSVASGLDSVRAAVAICRAERINALTRLLVLAAAAELVQPLSAAEQHLLLGVQS